MNKLFGTNGIRGIFAKDLTINLIHDLISSISFYFKKGNMLIGYDGRYSSILLSKIICSVLNYNGFDCHLIGLTPTPCLQLAVKQFNYVGGIMITASHNPSEYNGIKLIASDGIEISKNIESTIENIYNHKLWKIKSYNWGITKKNNNYIKHYIESIKSYIDIQSIRSKKFKIVLDLGNGVQSLSAPQICKDLGCIYYTLNNNIHGSFPGRGSEPTTKNLNDLSTSVIHHNADLGVAFDGDGDRCIFCDNYGTIINGNISALLLSEYILQNNQSSTIVTGLNSCSGIDTIAKLTNSKVIRTKVGSVNISRKMKSLSAIIGFEENGGFMFGKHHCVRDGAMTMALMLDLLSSTSTTMNNKINLLPKCFTTKIKINCTTKKANMLISKLKKNENRQYDSSDGLKIIFSKNRWIMIRKSGTEPIIRIYAEAENQVKLDELINIYTKKINILR